MYYDVRLTLQGTPKDGEIMEELAQFLEMIYGDQNGYVYAATKEADGTFGQHYYGWPAQQQALATFIQEKSSGAEVYVCPAIFSEASAQRVHVAGSRVAWADYDGNTPKTWEGLPEPNLVVGTSNPGHSHCYWLLESPLPSGDIERINRSIAYSTGADLSGWDANQLLRPPGTINHKRGDKPVRIIRARDEPRAVFTSLLEAPKLLETISFGEIPKVEDVIAKHKWEDKVWNLFKNPPASERSTAMTTLGYSFAEMGMTNGEIFCLLGHVADRVGKWSGRKDKDRRLTDLVTFIRIKHPEQSADGDDYSGFSLTALLKSEQNLDWLVRPYIHGTGLVVVTGPPGIGKSTLCLSLADSLCLGTEWLEYPVERKSRVGFLSLEMPVEELKPFVGEQVKAFNEAQRIELDNGVIVFPIGAPINVTLPQVQQRICDLIETYKLQGLIIDSLSSCTPEELTSDKQAKALYDFDVWLRKRYGIFTVHIHHNRKAQSDNKRPNKLSDVFGSSIMIIRPSTIITLWSEANGRIEFKPLKTRLGALPQPIQISRTPDLHFTRKAALQALTVTSGGIAVSVTEPIDTNVAVASEENPTGGEETNANPGLLGF